MCSQTGCKKCPADKDVCTECNVPSESAYNYATKRLDCALTLTPWPKERVRKEPLHNLVELLFETIADPKPTYTVKVVDLDTGKVYSCYEVGCTTKWSQNVLQTSFETNVRVARGQLLFFKTKTSRLLQAADVGHHRLLGDESKELIVIDDFQMMQEGWFFPMTKIVQILIFLFRTFGSMMVFTTSPVSAMLLEWVITHCMLLGLYLGPYLTTSELALQILGQIKIIWYWYPNPFSDWDSNTLTCAPRPNHGNHGLVCSFLDNYGQNAAGFAGLAVFLYLFHHLSGWMCGSPKSSTGEKDGFQEAVSSFGLTYWIAKLDANQLEITMYMVVSYSLADSSSKSVVGLVLASVLFLFFIGVAVGKTVLLLKALNRPQIVSNSSEPADPTHLNAKIAYVHPIVSTGSVPTSQSLQKPKYQQWLEYTLVGIKPITRKLQAAGPGLKVLRTVAICVLLLNHITSPVLQLSVGLGIEAAYFCSLFVTRTEEMWFDFYGSAAVQLLVVIFMALRLFSVGESIPVQQNQGQIATLLTLVVLTMLLVAFGSIFTAFFSMGVESRASRLERKRDIKKYRFEFEQSENKLQVIDELATPTISSQQMTPNSDSNLRRVFLKKMVNRPMNQPKL